VTGRDAFEWPDEADAPKGRNGEDFTPVDARPDAARMAPLSGETRRLCALCGRAFEHDDVRPAPFFPFCSSRCRAVDLGNWVNQAYVVEGMPGAADLDEDGPRHDSMGRDSMKTQDTDDDDDET
jgi:endogenous inhibitor of DNA gyrase (YacG/DUF329 family)